MKMNVSVGILFGINMSLLLLALPAAASDCTLGIFGNANRDDTINIQDVMYTQQIILGYKDQEQLADSKYDDTINMQDVTQIELIILEQEKELTILDGAGRVTTLSQPVERTIPLITGFTGFLYEFGAGDTIVGVPKTGGTFLPQYYYPQVEYLPDVGGGAAFSIEKVVELQPDVVFTTDRGIESTAPLVELGIPVIAQTTNSLTDLISNVIMIGTVVDRHKEAEAMAAGMEATFSMISEKTEDISKDDKPKVYVEFVAWGITYGANTFCTESVNLAGGVNIYGDSPINTPKPSYEYVVEENPDFIFIFVVAKDRQEFIEMAERDINELKNRPGWSDIDAVRNDQFCVIDNYYANFGPEHPESVVAMAKVLHPDLFTDLQFGEWVYITGGEA